MKVLQGIGLVRIARIEEAVKRQGKRFLDRVFTPAEREYCGSKRMKFEHYAARFAAKEAVVKALGFDGKKGIALNGIEVKREPTGKPYISLSGGLRKTAGLGVDDRIELSLAHEREYAVASVVIIKGK